MSSDDAKSYQGLHSAVRAIVMDALAKGPAATLTRNADLRVALGISAGTAQRALELLAERGALSTVSRGHLGRRIESINVGQCWQAAGLDPVRIALSPGGAIEMDALESTLGKELTTLGIPHTVQHQPGGVLRLQSIARREHDLTVVSSGTLASYEVAAAESWNGATRVLGPGTYYAADRIVAVRRAGEGPELLPTRVAIDRDSADHIALTMAEFDVSASTAAAEVPFPDVPGYVLAGLVDAGIWHITSCAVPVELTGLRLTPLRTEAARTVRDELSRATLACSSSRPELQSVISALEFADLERIQQAGFRREAARLAPLGIVRDRAL